MTDPVLSAARQMLGQRLALVARGWRREADAALAAYGLSEATAVPLMVLSRMGRCSRQATLAVQLGIEGPSLVRLLDALEAEGLVERHEDSHDRRAKALRLTAKGEAMAARIDAVLNGLRTRLLGTVSEADVEATMRVLAAVERALRSEDAAAGKQPSEAPA